MSHAPAGTATPRITARHHRRSVRAVAPAGPAFWTRSHGRPGRAAGTAAQYTWPGVYFEGRFRGTGVGLVLNDSNNDYDVQVDGTTVATLVTPGRTTYWVHGLADGDHTVRLAKRTESPWAAASSAASSPPPAAPS